jgi:putative SOS response-associated peptidase YedK
LKNAGGLVLPSHRTFTIVTTTPNALTEPIHNRMPVILEEDAIDDWLYARQSPDSLMELLRPAREDLLVATPVSARVNSVKNDDPECLEAPDPRAADTSSRSP